MIDEKDLSNALHDLAERDEVGPPPVERLIHQGNRVRARRTVLAAASVTAGALAITGAVITPRVTGNHVAAGAPVPLAVAAQNTERTTFRFAVTGVTLSAADTADGQPATNPRDLGRMAGAYDAVHQRGYFTWGDYDARRVGSECFYRNLKAPVVSPSDSGLLPPGVAPTGVWQRAWNCAQPETGQPGIRSYPDLGTFVGYLTTQGTVSYAGRTGTGGHAVDAYRYSYDVQQQLPNPPSTIDVVEHYTGTIEVNASTQRITRITSDRKIEIRNPDPRVKIDTSEFQLMLTLSDFGTLVDVATPTSPFPPDPTASPANR